MDLLEFEKKTLLLIMNTSRNIFSVTYEIKAAKKNEDDDSGWN